MRKFSPGTRALVLLAVLLLFSFGAAGVRAQAVAADPLRSYADVAEKTMPAVVNISTDKAVDGSGSHPFMDDPMFRRFFNMPDDDTHNNRERVERSLGSGIVISSDGRPQCYPYQGEACEQARLENGIRAADDAWNDDWVGVVLDTFNDDRRDYLFAVNPVGVQMDVIEVNLTSSTPWDGIWKSSAEIHDWGWSAEIVIPV